MERVAFVEIRIHPFAAFFHLPVIVRAGKRRQHEERGLIRLDSIHEVTDVLRHLLLGVKREADNVSGVHDYAGVVPFLDNRLVLFNVILSFTFGLQVLRIHALHPDKDLRAARFGRQPHEILRLTSEVNLHHESDLDAILFELDNFFEGLTPEFLAGKIIVSKEVEGDSVFAIVAAHHLANTFGAALAHFTTLDIDDGAKRACERTPPGSVSGAE